MSKAPKKTAKKATKKVAKKVAAPAPAPALDNLCATAAPTPARASAHDELTKMLAKKPTSQQEATEQMTAMLRRLIGDSSRHEAQIQFLGRSQSDSNLVIGEQLGYLEQCIRMLFEHAHIDMPKRQPTIVDAKIELVAPADLKDEQLDMRAAYSVKPHPVRGHYEVILGDDTLPVNKLHPKVLTRLVEAFEVKIQDETLVDGEFYFVRVHTIHNEPTGEGSIAIDRTTLEPTKAG